MKVIERALADPDTRRTGIALATATRDRRYEKSLKSLAEDPKTPEETRIAAVEGLGSFPDIVGRASGAIDRIGTGQGELESNR